MAEISPLRRRMIEDMTVRNLAPATQLESRRCQWPRHTQSHEAKSGSSQDVEMHHTRVTLVVDSGHQGRLALTSALAALAAAWA
jgi:hypothetical protein